MPDRDIRETRERVLLTLGCIIGGVWAIAVLVQVAFPNHVVPTEVHAVMLVLVPLLFGSAAWQARRNGKTPTPEGEG